MKLSEKDLVLVANWFDIAQDSLGDTDLKLFDQISSYLKEEISSAKEGREDDYLIFDARSSRSSDDEESDEDYLPSYNSY